MLGYNCADEQELDEVVRYDLDINLISFIRIMSDMSALFGY